MNTISEQVSVRDELITICMFLPPSFEGVPRGKCMVGTLFSVLMCCTCACLDEAMVVGGAEFCEFSLTLEDAYPAAAVIPTNQNQTCLL
eukprot:232070-Amphidinium_carterae.1